MFQTIKLIKNKSENVNIKERIFKMFIFKFFESMKQKVICFNFFTETQKIKVQKYT